MSRLIPEEIYQRIITALKGYRDMKDDECGRSACYCGYEGQEPHSQWIVELIDELERNIKRY